MAKKKVLSRQAAPQPGQPEPDFESALAEVEQIVAALESGQLGLSESLEQYEQGIKRLKRCHALLAAAEQRVSLLAGFDADGNPLTEPMEPSDFRTGAGRRRGVRHADSDHQHQDDEDQGDDQDDGALF